MKNYYALLLIIFLIFGISKQSLSSHYAGADLTYTCLGGNSYRITLSFYRDCSGIPSPPTVPIVFSCSSNSQFNFSYTLTALPGTGQEVSPSCSAMPSKCNGGVSYGIQEHVYQAIVTLAPCNKWIMSYTSCCRNPVITVPNNSSNSWYIHAELDNLNAPSNSSPSFTNKPNVVVCTNQPVNYNNGAIDPDGDSLVYSLYAPYTNGPTASIVYAPPYAASNFILSNPPVTLDPTTGDINFTAVNSVITITGIKVEEWRKINGVPTLIGIVYRDVQLKSEACNNYNMIPTLSGIDELNTHTYSLNDSSYQIEMCLGSTIDFDINGHDSDVYNPLIIGRPDIFYISWNQGIPLGSFTTQNNGTDSAYAHFSWTPTSADVSNLPKCFTATIHDDACPYYGSKSFRYCIKVNPPLNPPIIGNDTTICINHTLLLDAGPADSYLWFNGDTTQTTLVDASTLGVGNHQVGVTISTNGCLATDSFNLTVDACTGLNMAKESFDFQINPNPGNGIFNITFKQNMISTTNIEVLNAFGQLIMKKEDIKTDRNSFQIDLSNLEKGVYFIKIYEIQGIYPLTKRVVIQ